LREKAKRDYQRTYGKYFDKRGREREGKKGNPL